MKDLSKYKMIGLVTEDIISITDFNSSGQVYVAPGLLKHIKKHLKEFSEKEKEDIFSTMIDIFNNPDYIGTSPSKLGDSFELIKKFDNNILLAVEIDKYNNYNYVSSMYPISEGKINNRLNSSRIIKIKTEAYDEVAVTKQNDNSNIK